jgi:hypothetical protein
LIYLLFICFVNDDVVATDNYYYYPLSAPETAGAQGGPEPKRGLAPEPAAP